MAHEVKFSIPERELGRSDVRFAVKKDGELLGKLEISNGSIVWFPKNTREGHRISWTKFNEIMVAQAPDKERR